MDLMQKKGSRAELVSELREMAEGWHHLCKDDLSAKAAEMADELESGSFSVKVGHTIYSVVSESSDEPHT